MASANLFQTRGFASYKLFFTTEFPRGLLMDGFKSLCRWRDNFHKLVVLDFILKLITFQFSLYFTLFFRKLRWQIACTFHFLCSLCFNVFYSFKLCFSPHSNEDFNQFWHILRMTGFCLSFANSCTNPVALYFVSGTFRKHFNRCVNSFSVRHLLVLTSSKSPQH